MLRHTLAWDGLIVQEQLLVSRMVVWRARVQSLKHGGLFGQDSGCLVLMIGRVWYHGFQAVASVNAERDSTYQHICKW